MRKYTPWLLVVLIIAIIAGLTREGKAEQNGVAEAFAITSHSSKQNNLDGIDIICTVKNDGDKLADAVTVDATFTDATGKPVGTGFGVAYNVPAHEERTLTVKSIDIINATDYKLNIGNVTINE